MQPAIIEFPSRGALMQGAADILADALTTAIATRGAGCAALSGGSTPIPAYERLAAMTLEWLKITFALVDERFVPIRDEASNEGMLERVLAPAFEKGAKFVPMYFAAQTLEQAARSADWLLTPGTIDIALLGMGEDGHTASWFEGAEGLDAALDLSSPWLVVPIRAPQAQGAAERLTLTRAALSGAGRIVLLMTGAAKRARLEAALAGDWAPVTALFDPAMPRPEVLWAP